MHRFSHHTGTVMPLRRSDIDTDQISPARFVPYYARGGYTNILFADWRDDPAFVLNQPEHQGATILVAGTNFGTGSSRESAVWALQSAGFRVVLAPRFGDIFHGNALTRGLPAVTLPAEEIETLWDLVDADPWLEVTVDLHTCQVRHSGRTLPFAIDPAARERLLRGADLVTETLRHDHRIARFERARHPRLPRTFDAGPHPDPLEVAP
ncbi:3-isopropylmalate dehydratase small subunit [Amycolatopsis sp., V23-08]|uniref:3-isopropylmalate dehydratase small subunit n=1 Tax=Amycolatopsis heterodermiae TaxID=3110235 RepID=A0ABU5R2C2_9PSEU|nr:3-isopropylmalate dehydratase small subunit [Amycolatopsis sp., V23-08]MEA5360337.1 3-isopropylmalate dehydratase small subunit [Amycolatopsis sp., V23-08]